MPLLLYCVTPESAAETPVSGVGGVAVRSRTENGLRFFYSDVVGQATTSPDVVAAAQQVHAVVRDIFSRSAVLPFRYPTTLKDEDEFVRLASERGAKFLDFLKRMGGKVQMDVRLSITSGTSDETLHRSPKTGERVGQPGTGRAYLEARGRRQALLSAAAEKCRQAATSAEWRNQQQGENIRCQALIPRVEVVSFSERMRALELPDGVKAAVSGPWPPAGFWDDDSG